MVVGFRGLIARIRTELPPLGPVKTVLTKPQNVSLTSAARRMHVREMQQGPSQPSQPHARNGLTLDPPSNVSCSHTQNKTARCLDPIEARGPVEPTVDPAQELMEVSLIKRSRSQGL